MPTPAQRLIYAVRTRNPERLRELIREGNAVSSQTAAGRTALHAAAEEGDRAAAVILIEAGADVNARMHDGLTALHLAAARGGFCDLADPDPDRRNPCNRRRNRPLTPEAANVLAEIIKSQHPDLPAGLGPADEIPQEFKAEVFGSAFNCLADPAQLLKEFAARGMDLDLVDPDMAEDLRGNPRFLGLVELLLQHGADINAVDNYSNAVLKNAIELGQPAMVELLLAHGADPNRQPKPEDRAESLIEAALGRSRIDVADALVRHGAKFDPNASGLYTAVANGRRNALEWLLDHGADINLRDEAGNTPLLAAAESGHEDSMAALLSRGADVHARNHEGNGVLHAAAKGLGCLKLALSLRLPVNEPNSEGQTALHLVAQHAEPSVLQALLQAGADSNLRDGAGNTALHRLFNSYEFRPDIEFPAFLTLVMAGADRSIQNGEHKTAFALATEHEYPEEYLRLLNPEVAVAPGQFVWLGETAYAGFLPKALVSFELDGDRWPSAWHYFHAQKTADREIRERIRQAPTVNAAMGRLRDAKVEPSLAWPSRCDAVMHAALLAKFQQHAALRGQLLAIGDVILVCDEGCESYWLERRGAEFNALGKMLMNIRSELHAASGKNIHHDH